MHNTLAFVDRGSYFVLHGMHRQGLPSDHWIDAFYSWLIAEGFAKK